MNQTISELLPLKKAFLLLFTCTWMLSSCAAMAQNRKGVLPKGKDEVDISLTTELLEDRMVLWAENKTFAPLQLDLKLESNDSIVQEFIIEPHKKIEIKSWPKPVDKEVVVNDFNDTYKFSYYFGDPRTTNPDTDYLYRLPFKKGKAYSVSQSFGGKFSHHSIQSKYAIDFQLEIGEPVFAARDGLVVKVQSHFKEHGGKEFLYKANRIIVLHDDGTTASYVHLDYNGALVSEGDRVKRGQKIGYSGLTGYTRGPHLHFVVRKEKDIAIPIYFEGYEGKVLKKRRKYKVKK